MTLLISDAGLDAEFGRMVSATASPILRRSRRAPRIWSGLPTSSE